MATRKITIMGELHSLESWQKEDIDKSMIRMGKSLGRALSLLTKGYKNNPEGPVSPENIIKPTVGEIEKRISKEMDINSRESKDCVNEAQALIESQKKLIPEYIQNYKDKIAKIDRTLKRTDLSDEYRQSQISKREKRQKKLDFYETHNKNKTIPTIKFAKRDLIDKRLKNEISKDEFERLKYYRYFSRGDKSKGGNPHLKIGMNNKNELILKIPKYEKVLPKKSSSNNPAKQIEFMETPLYVAQKLSKKTKLVNGINYKKMLLEHLNTEQAYYVQIIRKDEKYYVHITITIDTEREIATSLNGILGVDVNPDGIAITIITKQGNYKFHIFLKCSDLMNARSTKRTNLAGELAKTIVNIALQYGVAISIEDLSFSQNKDCKKRFNRIRHNFAYRKMIDSIKSRCLSQGVELIEVNPAYTSKIGLYKYALPYGMDIHNGAAMVIARRAYGFRERIPKKLQNRFISKSSERKFLSKRDNGRFAEIDAKYKAWLKKYNKNKNNKVKLNYKPNGYIHNKGVVYK